MVAQDACRQAMGHGLKEVEVRVKGPGAGRESAVRAMQAIGLEISVIKDVTPVRTTAAARRNSAASDASKSKLENLESKISNGPQYRSQNQISRRYNVLIGGSAKASSARIILRACTARRARAARSPTTRSRSPREAEELAPLWRAREAVSSLFRDSLRRSAVVTGELLLQLLETRIDNVIYRLGFAKTRQAARQLVAHGHVRVNGRKLDVASANVKPGDKVADQGRRWFQAPRAAEPRADADCHRARMAARGSATTSRVRSRASRPATRSIPLPTSSSSSSSTRAKDSRLSTGGGLFDAVRSENKKGARWLYQAGSFLYSSAAGMYGCDSKLRSALYERHTDTALREPNVA